MTKQDGGVENPKEAAGRKKVQLQLVPPAAMHEMALALQCGADKYGAWNWRAAGINLMTYLGAMRRHIDAILDGEDRDKDSGVSHIGHVLAGAAICCDAASVGMLRDDRPGRPASARERALARIDELKDKADRLRMAMAGEPMPGWVPGAEEPHTDWSDRYAECPEGSA